VRVDFSKKAKKTAPLYEGYEFAIAVKGMSVRGAGEF